MPRCRRQEADSGEGGLVTGREWPDVRHWPVNLSAAAVPSIPALLAQAWILWWQGQVGVNQYDLPLRRVRLQDESFVG
jgi:hypothetical protein